MWFKLRYTARRGRSAVPFTFFRILMCRRGRPFSLGVAADFIALSFPHRPGLRGRLSARGLARLAAYVLAGVADALPLVRLGRTEIADDRRGLAHLLLAVSADHDLRLSLRRDGDPLRRVVLDRVRVPKLQHQLLAAHLGAVPRTLDLEHLGESLRDAFHHVREDRARGAVKGERLLAASDLRDQDLVGLQLHVDAVGEPEFQLSLGSLHVDRLGFALHLHALRDLDRHFSYSRWHGWLLPDAKEVLATEPLVPRFDIGHDAARRRDDRRPHPTPYLGNLVAAQIEAASGLAHALDPLDDASLLGVVLEIDAEKALLLVVDRLVVVDELLLEQEAYELRLHIRGRNVHLLVLRLACVADARQEIRDGIANR